MEAHSKVITPELTGFIRKRFLLEWQGIHGAPHWARVRQNGLLLLQGTGANRKVVELFAFLHDVERQHDGHDPEHGLRAADLVNKIAGKLIDVDDYELKLLTRACQGHSEGYTKSDITVMTCWDADRLDLGRVGIKPSASKLCTDTAKDPEIIERCYQQSLENGY